MTSNQHVTVVCYARKILPLSDSGYGTVFRRQHLREAACFAVSTIVVSRFGKSRASAQTRVAMFVRISRTHVRFALLWVPRAPHCTVWTLQRRIYNDFQSALHRTLPSLRLRARHADDTTPVRGRDQFAKQRGTSKSGRWFRLSPVSSIPEHTRSRRSVSPSYI